MVYLSTVKWEISVTLNLRSKARNKCILAVGFMVAAGCSNEAVKNEAVKWVNTGILISMDPDVESIRRPSRVKSAVLSETKLSRTLIETTEGVYVVGEKIGIEEMGIPISVGYNSLDENRDTPLYLSFGGQRYKIVR